MSNREIVDRFFARWCEGDIAGAMAECTDDVVWDNVPMNVIEGRPAVQAFLEKFANGLSDPHYDIRNVLEKDDVLMIEGVENYTKNGRNVSVPYMASFKFRDGKICLWRDYFDLRTVERQLA